MGRTWNPQQAEEAAGHPASEGDPEPQPDGRTSRTASLVSGLLTELYSCTEEEEVAAGADRASQCRPRRRDSLDSSTETSGSDVFLGGRGAGDSRVLQELRERPSLRLQMQYLQRKGERRRGDSCPPAPLVCPPAPGAHLRHLSHSPTCTCPPAPVAHLRHLLHLSTRVSCSPAPPVRRRPARPRTRRVWSLHLTQDSTITLSLDCFPNAQPLPLCRCGSERGRVCPPSPRRSGVPG